MKIHEYQAKDLFLKYGIATQRGYMAEDAVTAKNMAKALGEPPYVVKAQVHCGGRGKAGGVKLVNSLDEVGLVTNKMLGMKIVTPQTGAEGKIVHKVLVTNAIDIAKEYYLSLTVDSENEGLTIIASSDGGTEIEVTAQKNPEKIFRQFVSAEIGLRDFHSRDVAVGIGLGKEHLKSFSDMLKSMYKLFIEKDCSLIEINPLIITKKGELLALDAKINFDDNSLFRHPDIAELRDYLEENPKEVEADKYNLNYIALDGSIGCMVNGAGLAMATMDIINSFGGKAANFLDVGGSATAEKVTAAFKILLSDKNVRAIMVNIFGGIMKCDVIAEGIVEAVKVVNLKVPLIVRLDGTNVDRGKEILSQSGIKVLTAGDMAEAAKLAVESVKEAL